MTGVILIAIASNANYSFGDGKAFWIEVIIRLVFFAAPGLYLLQSHGNTAITQEPPE